MLSARDFLILAKRSTFYEFTWKEQYPFQMYSLRLTRTKMNVDKRCKGKSLKVFFLSECIFNLLFINWMSCIL